MGRWRWQWCLCHIEGVETKIDLTTADRDVLIGIIVRQQAIIQGLEKRVAQLEGQAKPSGSRRMPGLKPKADGKPAQPKGPRQPRRHGFARTRMTPTQRVEHVVEQCPDCGSPLSWGWTQRTREVIDLPQVPGRLPSTSTWPAPVPFANGAAFPQRNRTARRWAGSGWGCRWSA